MSETTFNPAVIEMSGADIAALREAVVSSMENELAKAIRGQLRTQVLDALYAANPIEVPKSMITEQVQAMQVDFELAADAWDETQAFLRDLFAR